jgi:hypothetical protein
MQPLYTWLEFQFWILPLVLIGRNIQRLVDTQHITQVEDPNQMFIIFAPFFN